MSTVYIGHAVGDEHGQASGGEAGNQNGKELRTQPWYLNKKGWVVLRPKDSVVASKLAYDMKAACNNMNIGYDQKERNTLFREAEKVGFNCAKVVTPCECDCSALVIVCLWYAGIKVGHFNTASEVSALMKTGKFEKLTDAKYTECSDYLRTGDILVTKVKGHTAIVLNDGSKAESKPDLGQAIEPIGYTFTRLLKYGCKGEDVIELKKLLVNRGYTKGITLNTTASKNFGSSTKNLVKQYQKDNGLTVDGIAGRDTITSLGGTYIG